MDTISITLTFNQPLNEKEIEAIERCQYISVKSRGLLNFLNKYTSNYFGDKVFMLSGASIYLDEDMQESTFIEFPKK